jgi:hypothetical protein
MPTDPGTAIPLLPKEYLPWLTRVQADRAIGRGIGPGWRAAPAGSESSKATWLALVNKMIQIYKAPVAERDVGANVDYLARIKGAD